MGHQVARENDGCIATRKRFPECALEIRATHLGTCVRVKVAPHLRNDKKKERKRNGVVHSAAVLACDKPIPQRAGTSHTCTRTASTGRVGSAGIEKERAAKRPF